MSPFWRGCGSNAPVFSARTHRANWQASCTPPLPTDAFCFDVCLRLAKAGQSHEAHEMEEVDPDDAADDSLPVSDESLP
jgi:hypothetical protein